MKDDRSIVGGIGRFQGMAVTVIGHQRGEDTKDNIKRNFGMPHPEGYRKALRLMKQAEKFNRPVITFIDTPGAYPGMEAEERGQSEAIARNLFEMSKLNVPITSIVIGEGGSGGALALGVCDKLIMLEHAVYSVASPNAAASILFKNPDKVGDVAEVLKITAQDLLEYGIIDEIVKEPAGGAHKNFDEQIRYLSDSLLTNLKMLLQVNRDTLIARRKEKLMNIGVFHEAGV